MEQVEKKQVDRSFSAVGRNFYDVDNCFSAVIRRTRKGGRALEEGDVVDSSEQRWSRQSSVRVFFLARAATESLEDRERAMADEKKHRTTLGIFCF